jgi:hypothetical protein
MKASEDELEFIGNELSYEEAEAIAEMSRNVRDREKKDELLARVIKDLKSKGKTSGARYIAARIISGQPFDNIVQLSKDWWSHRAIKDELSSEEMEEIDASPGKLRRLGIRFGWEARRFYRLYSELHNPKRPWGSSCQPPHKGVLSVATTPNYNRLPLWVKRVLVCRSTQSERPGNIWRLIPCAKAWKWNPAMPKGIAEKIGKLPVRSRLLAALAWEETAEFSLAYLRVADWTLRFEDKPKTRAEIISDFWDAYRRLHKASILEVLEERLRFLPDLQTAVEIYLGLPWKSLMEGTPYSSLEEYENDYDNYDEENTLEALVVSKGTPRQICLALFNSAGKATVRAFKASSQDAYRWASALGDGNPDYIQTILGLETLINWEPEATDFLRSLPMESRIRLLKATTFKYRGGIYPVSTDHVRDTGYLWKNIQSMPELGRIRCWFSIHETLAGAFVKELPDDDPLPTERTGYLDGVASVEGTWDINVPKNVGELKYVGERLHNCVGAYGPAIKSGRSDIFYIRESGIITHCIEIENGAVEQFYCAHNRSADRRIKQEVTKLLGDAKVIRR